MKFIDLFCGIGGFRLGLEKSNKQQQEEAEANGCGDSVSNQGEQSKQSPQWGNYTCVWSNDNGKYACQIYRKHWGEVCEQDIRAVAATTIPEHGLLCAGFPCQSFSIAGKRRGFEDIRGTLFFEICRVLWAKRPSYLFLENVKGLLSHDGGATFQTIIGTLDELGYDCQWQVLNSKDYGVPQNRERVFIVGHLRGQPRPKVFPVGEVNQSDAEAQRKAQGEGTRLRYANTLSQRYGKDGSENLIAQALGVGGSFEMANYIGMKQVGQLGNKDGMGQRVYSSQGLASSLRGEGGGQGGKTGLYSGEGCQRDNLGGKVHSFLPRVPKEVYNAST